MKNILKFLNKNREVVLFDLLFRLMSKKYYWYEVKFVYKNKSGTEVLHWYHQIGLKHQDTILDYRQIKKIVKPLHMYNAISKYSLCNGNFTLEEISYLGRFNNTYNHENKR